MIIALLMWVVTLLILAYVAYWICQKFNAPQPVIWIVGLVLLLVLLAKVGQLMGVRLP